MGLPSHPDYYRDFPKATLQKKVREGLAVFSSDIKRNGMALHPAFRSLLENNLANKDRIDYLRKLGKRPVAYLARGKGKEASVFKNIRIRVLAPKGDVSVYYTASGRERALTAALAAADGGQGKPRRRTSDEGFDWDFSSVARASAADRGGMSASDSRATPACHPRGGCDGRAVHRQGAEQYFAVPAHRGGQKAAPVAR
jgi:hypothetical protein